MPSKRQQERERMVLKSQQVNAFIYELLRESDRAAAILGAALLDEKILQLLRAFLITDTKEIDLLLSTERPLGSFGARIRTAYCLGLMTRRVFEILMVIKDIRNAFAHQLHGLSFADPDVANDFAKLRSMLREPAEIMKGARMVFVVATLLAQRELTEQTASVETSGRRCKVPEGKTPGAIL